MTDAPAPCRITPATPEDAADWLGMRRLLGPDWLVDRVDAFADAYFASGTIDGLPHAVLIARDRNTSAPLGFAEVSLREYAEGCTSSPVGYLEGWFVAERARGRGVGAALVAAAERWAASRGCVEFASDAEIDNRPSLNAHAALGFEAVCDIRCFRKALAPLKETSP